MGGERSSTARQRQGGKICAECRIPLDHDPNHKYGERLCPRCADNRIPKRAIFMNYSLVDGHWRCHFLEADLKTPLRRKLHFYTDEKLIEMAKRGRALKDLADKQALEHGMATGRGSLNLHLTSSQYEALKRVKA